MVTDVACRGCAQEFERRNVKRKEVSLRKAKRKRKGEIVLGRLAHANGSRKASGKKGFLVIVR